MIGLLRNEWLKVVHNKKLYGFMAVVLLMQLLPVLFTMMANLKTLNGQVYPLNMMGVITSFAMPVFIIIIVAEIFTEELLSGNLSLSLTQPVTRSQVFLAKVIFILLLIFLLQIYSLILGYMLGTVIFGWSGEFMLRGASYSITQGIVITVASYLTAVLPLWAFGLFVIFLTGHIMGGAAVVGVAAGIFMTMNIIYLLADELRPLLINSYFNTVPFVLAALDKPQAASTPLIFCGFFALVFFFWPLFVFLRKDMVY